MDNQPTIISASFSSSLLVPVVAVFAFLQTMEVIAKN
jgi:hypothetical protein